MNTSVWLVAGTLCAIMALPACGGDAPSPGTPTPQFAPPPASMSLEKPFLGVNVDANGSDFAPGQGLPITNVIPSCTAATMGLKVGDKLLAFNGQPLHSQADLVQALGQIKVGDAVTIDYTRKDTTKQTASGVMKSRPNIAQVQMDVHRVKEELDKLSRLAEEKKKSEISLQDVLIQLKQIEQNLPAAIADFKKQYPNGEFNISIKIDIVSDKTAKQSIEIGNQPGADLKAPVVPSPPPVK